ncbi:glycogen/starch/alpha-glucan phosphorylase [Clostridium aestuarii]|uniref:Alpha-1,4 glucan phosphorylase n=1 Tax=Clostridium aestuarii TaxID=338193 RepID=A0ABT4CY21_9CLOT|nr:glycogen/starch/alpha-glucan phosphorylase [Clostridium aestuarii]MCY6483870.1 glycogen/starch/alpha-glucan phosphorylase [Clostridium aestuarii]
MLLDKEIFKKDFKRKLITMFSEEIGEASSLHKYLALGGVVKEYMSEKWMKTNKQYTEGNNKQIYYFSLEFLIGKLLESNLINMGIRDICDEALKEMNIDLIDLENIEKDAGLGNGGLGRLAACFLDSMASLGIPGHGCGIRYKFGLFEQQIVDGYQIEVPDNWLKHQNIWETRKEDKAVIVKFGGNSYISEDNGKLSVVHQDYEPILAVPYDIPIVGYNKNNVNTLRLWSAETVDKDLNLEYFNSGEYLKAVEYKYSVESISQVLYPDNSNKNGKILRLKQQYFFVSAGLQSIIKRYKKMNVSLERLHEYIAVQINDTHPAVAVAELMRILIDEEGMNWDIAWNVTTNTMAYTNHTILAEALEKWPVDMFKKLLPRIYMIVEEIDRRFCSELMSKYHGDWNRINQMSIIHDGNIRMAHLAIVGSHSVNGVAKLHTEILKNQELSNFNNFYPKKINNKTNGITHRRWLIKSNKNLSGLITETIGESWIEEPIKLKELEKYSKDTVFQEKIAQVKENNKINFSNYIKQNYNIDIDPHSIFDVQVKRLHAYKRQILNVMNIMDTYNRLRENPNMDITPRTFFFGAKAFPGYHFAKQTIKLINSVASKINNDSTINGKLKVVFLENYGVSIAEKIIPCANVSEQISTASKEASGTGNMKFMMNGAITVATLDGANVEILESVGEDNIVKFGLNAEEVINYYKQGGYISTEIFNNDPRVNRILTQFTDGFLNVAKDEFNDIYHDLIYNNDEYFVLKDFDSYVNAQNKIEQLYRNHSRWQEMCIVNIANSGIFSSDNTIRQYADNIWNVHGVPVKL